MCPQIVEQGIRPFSLLKCASTGSMHLDQAINYELNGLVVQEPPMPSLIQGSNPVHALT